jgi:hypothetical protein
MGELSLPKSSKAPSETSHDFGMDERSLLLGKVDALLEQLEWAKSSLSRAKLEEQIREAATTGFDDLFNRRREELNLLRKSIEDTGPSGGVWNKLHGCSSACKELFEECLGFLGGAMLRDVNKKDDICEIADALLRDIGTKTKIPWGGATVLANTHFYTETTGLVRLPFPDYGIWTLPIAVHELGHFIGPRISDGVAAFPFQTRLDNIEKKYAQKEISEEQKDQESSHLRELFSDLFAVHVLGPAYACACIVLSFDPQDEIVFEDGLTHPSHAKRVYFMLAVLQQISKKNGNLYEEMMTILRELWERVPKNTQREKCLDQKSIPPLKFQLQQLYPIVSQYISSARYKGWSRAAGLSKEFPLERKPAEVLQKDDAIADVLNAVWIWRFRQSTETRLICAARSCYVISMDFRS